MITYYYQFLFSDKLEKNDSTTLAIETEVFKKRIAALFEFVEYVKKYKYFAAKLKKISEQLKKLNDDIDKIGSLNSGGKFEWVDSVLIKVSNNLKSTIPNIIELIISVCDFVFLVHH